MSDKSSTSSILRPIQLGLIIPPTSGQRTFVQAKDIFRGGVYGESCNIVSEARPETPVIVHELSVDGNFQQIFGNQGVPLEQPCLTQDQIIEFAFNYSEHLHPNGYATFFLFKVEGCSLVANAYWNDERRLEVLVFRFAYDGVWGADGRPRVVLPQLTRFLRLV